MTDDKITTHKWAMREMIQLAPAVAVVVTALSFSVGLLIVNIHLAAYGIFSSELIRTEYVLAGTLFCFLVAFTRFALDLAKYQFQDADRDWKEGKRGRALVSIIFAILAFVIPESFALMIVSGLEVSIASISYFRIMAILVLAAIVVGRLSDHIRGAWINITTPDVRQSPRRKRWLGQLESMLAAILILLTLVAAYSLFVYPKLYSALGGARKDQVILVPKEETLESVRAIGFELNMNLREKAIGPLDVILVSEKEVVVVLDNYNNNAFKVRAIRLNRDMFKAIVNVVAE